MRTVSVKSAARVLDLLELMAAFPSGLRLTEGARRLGMPKSSASALFATLRDRGYVEVGPDGYRLAQRFRSGGWIGGEYAQLMRIAKPIMARLVAETKETAFLGIMSSDWGIQYVAKVVSENPLRYDVDLGEMRPAYCTSIGLVMLADQPDEAIQRYLSFQPLEKITPHTITDPQSIRRAIARVRRQGYAALADSNVSGTSGVATPVTGASGRTIAGLAVIAPSSRFKRRGDNKVRQEAIRATTEAAAQMGAQLAAFGDGVAESHSGQPRLAHAG